MADELRVHSMEWEEVDSETDRLFAETESSHENHQPNTNHIAHPGAAELESEVDNEIDRLIAEADEIDRDIDRLIAEAGFDVEDTLDLEPLGHSATADASFESAPSTGQTGQGSVETGNGFSPSISADVFVPLGSQTAAYRSTGGIRDVAGMRGFIEWTMTSSRWIPSRSTALESLESLPVVKIRDLPEEFHNCHICKEAFEDKEDSEAPIRLPCRHIFGRICLSKWISQNTCPLCRAEIVGPHAFNTLAQDGEVREPSVSTRPVFQQTTLTPTPRVRLPRFSRPTPLTLQHIDGATEENVPRVRLPPRPTPLVPQDIGADEGNVRRLDVRI